MGNSSSRAGATTQGNKKAVSVSIQRRKETRTVNGVTTTTIVETRTERDENGTVTTTTTTTTDKAGGDGTQVEEANQSCCVGCCGARSANRESEYRPASSGTNRSEVRLQIGSRGTAGHQTDKGSKSGHQTDKQFVKQVVDQHNLYRRRHGKVADLKLNKDLCKMSENYAKHLASIRTLQHSDKNSRMYRNQSTGENLAFQYSSAGDPYTGENVVQSWYSEIDKYSFPRSEFIPGTGHFTQVVWKGSTEIGVGRAFADDGQRVYVVCNYFPAGNVIGQFKENVLPAR